MAAVVKRLASGFGDRVRKNLSQNIDENWGTCRSLAWQRIRIQTERKSSNVATSYAYRLDGASSPHFVFLFRFVVLVVPVVPTCTFLMSSLALCWTIYLLEAVCFSPSHITSLAISLLRLTPWQFLLFASHLCDTLDISAKYSRASTIYCNFCFAIIVRISSLFLIIDVSPSSPMTFQSMDPAHRRLSLWMSSGRTTCHSH